MSGEFSHNMLILKWKTETKKFKTQDVNDKGYSRYLKVSKNMKKPKLRFFTKLEVISFIKLVDYENSCARSFFNEAFRREGQYNSNWIFWYFICLNILGKINYKEMYLNNHHLAKFIIDWSSASEDTCLISHMTSRTRDGRISWRTSLHVTLPSLLTKGIVVVEIKCF